MLEARTSIAATWITLASSLLRIYEAHHPQRWYLAPLTTSGSDSLENQLGRQPSSFVPKEAVHPGARPRVANVLRIRPARCPYRTEACRLQHDTSTWRNELRRANLAAVVVPISERQHIPIVSMRQDPAHQSSQLQTCSCRRRFFGHWSRAVGPIGVLTVVKLRSSISTRLVGCAVNRPLSSSTK